MSVLELSPPHDLRVQGYGAPLPAGSDVSVPELVAEHARREPDRIAVRAVDGSLDYAQLHRWAGALALRLRAAGVGPGSRVGLLVGPSTAMVAAALAILRAGAAYVPVDESQPDARITEVFTDAGVTCAVGTEHTAPRLSGLGLPLVVVTAGAADSDGTRGPVEDLPSVGASDAAYVIYTSGSTGEPKGVLIEHGQLSASTRARHAVYPGAPVFLLVSSLAFDSSVAGLWGTLTSGGTLVVGTADEVRDPTLLVELVRRHGVTALLCVPSLYAVLLDAAERVGLHRLASLDTVTVAGESLPESLLRRHFELHRGAVALVNEYGPTETAVWASYRRYDEPGPVSIGGPVPGARLYVLDQDLRPVAPGAEGELCIGGAGVARGYLGRPEATAAVFVRDPFADDGSRLYRTGDRARWTTEGTLEFLGRRDHQVKIRGNRVELGAVEAVLRQAPGVRDAVVVADRPHTGLVGFVLAEPGASGCAPAARQHAAQRLAAGLVPARIDELAEFPLTFTGKVDRALLTERADLTPAAEPSTVVAAGQDPVIARVAAAWAEVLERAEVPLDANFFELGGHSLAMFKLQDALERHTGIRPSVVALFRHTTVSAQAALIASGNDGATTGRRQAAVRRLAARSRRQSLQTSPEPTS